MRLLARTGEPDILRKKSAGWTSDFVASSESRPDAKKYRHAQVVEALRGMSHNKCFYCECALNDGDEQVDHHIEAALDRTLAFAWPNLYLACKSCNVGKPTHHDIPVGSCVDPCGTVAVEAHLEFVDEDVRPHLDSSIGDQTIKKYRLRRHSLLRQRMLVLKQLWKDHTALLKRCNAEGGRPFTDAERARLRAYAGPTMPFSACCAAWLRAEGL